jgi:hypothetical protein
MVYKTAKFDRFKHSPWFPKSKYFTKPLYSPKTLKVLCIKQGLRFDVSKPFLGRQKIENHPENEN